jgi:hypothetical protein
MGFLKSNKVYYLFSLYITFLFIDVEERWLYSFLDAVS